MFGQVASVEIRLAGTQLVGAHSIGVSVLQVADVSEIPDGGGVVLVGANSLTYTSVTDTSNPDATAANCTIVLAAVTTVAYTDGQLVTLTPVRPYKIALVVPTGETVAIEAVVSHPMYGLLTEGPRQTGTGEIVSLTERDDSLVLVDVLGRQPSLSGTYLSAATVGLAALAPDVLITLSSGPVDGGLL